MAKKKRKNIKIAKSPKEMSRTKQERSYIMVKKMMPIFDLEPDIFDIFTKRQKQLLFGLIFEFPSVKNEKENTIPRLYLNKIRDDMLYFMKTSYFGNPECGFTYMDFTIYGYAFYILLSTFLEKGTFNGTPQEEIAKRICDTIENSELFNKEGYYALHKYLLYQTRSYSQVNYRLYGFTLAWDEARAKMTVDSFTTMQMKIQLTVQDCETKMFRYNNIDRKAFRMIYTADGAKKARGAVIKKNKIYPDAKDDEELNIYIQSHALNRYKQRVDILEARERNYYIQHVLITDQLVIRYEKQNLLACMLDNAIIGYFTYFIKECDMVVNTFIPITSENTPEGKKLRNILILNNDDIVFLGMDKLSFYSMIDFEQIPTMKQALIDSEIWKTKLVVDNVIINLGNKIIDEKKTKFVKQYLEKNEQYRTEMLLHSGDEN